MADPSWKPPERASLSPPFEPLLDSEEAAALLKMHPKTLQRMARRGELPAHPLAMARESGGDFCFRSLTDGYGLARMNLPPVPRKKEMLL